MIAPDLNSIPASLTDLPRWLLWHEEPRAADGKPTKVPKTAANRAASSTNPKTWSAFTPIADALRTAPQNRFDGLGIVLGVLPDGRHICGIDLDCCLDEHGNLAPWARPIVEALRTYLERSPGGRGLKSIFLARAEDAGELREMFGIDAGKWGNRRSVIGAANGEEHGPAIETYLGPGRYFTVTGKPWGVSLEDVAMLSREELHRIGELVRAATAPPKTQEREQPRRPRDTSRSAAAFRLGARLRREGASFEEMCEAIRTHPETAVWCREKGDANGGRELRNIWDNAAPASELPTIIVRAGGRHLAADAGLAAMHEAGVPFYRRDKDLVRILRIQLKLSDGGDVLVPAVVPIAMPTLLRTLGLSAQWQKFNHKGEQVGIDPPTAVAEQILSMIDEWPFPPLRGVIATPSMRYDGTLLTEPGYDPATGLVLFEPPAMPEIPEHPSKAAALDALALLNDLLAEFVFADDDNVSRSAAVSMIMTAVLRGAMPVAPMHVITKPVAGSGGSYMQDIVAAIAIGDRCPVISLVPGDDKENDKRLNGAALAQQPIIALDNLSSTLMGDFLCQLIERPMVQIRRLGGSDMIHIPNSAFVIANGNNLVVGADTVRRTVQIALDADMEDPETRSFSRNPVAEVLADRGRYVAAILTIARAYVVAGRPGRLRPLASFERWSDIVRSALVWLNWPDPVQSTNRVRAEDPVRSALLAVITAWASELQVGLGYHSAELIMLAGEYHSGSNDRVRPALWEALFGVAGTKVGQIDPVRLGLWLRANLNRVIADHKLLIDRDDKARPRWLLVPR